VSAARLGDNGRVSGTLQTAVRQAHALDDVSRRPWPLPEQPWLGAHTYRDVLLAYWPAPLDAIARPLPSGLAADTWNGEAWAGVACARVTSLRVRGLPPLPGLSSFPQVELLAPVTDGDRPGLWLFSLEIGRQLFAELAKRTHRLPAYGAQIAFRTTAAGVAVEARRDGLELRARYAPAGDLREPEPGSFEHFVAERYALYTSDGGRLYRADVHHAPWRLARAEAHVAAATLAPLPLEGAPRALYAAEQDLLVWPLEELR